MPYNNPLDITNHMRVLQGAADLKEKTGSAIGGMLGAVSSIKRRKTLEARSDDSYAIERETKLLDLGKGYLQRVNSVEDYDKYTQYMKKLGAPDMFPKITSQEQLESYKEQAIVSADQYAKIIKGEKFKMWKDMGDGTSNEVQVTKKEMADYEKRGYQIGDRQGTPYKSLEQLKLETETMEEIKAKKAEAARAAELEKAKAVAEIGAKSRVDAAKIAADSKKDVAEKKGGKIPTTKISDVDKEELKNIRDDERNLNSLIKQASLRAQYDDDVAQQVKTWQDALVELEAQRKAILDEYKQPSAPTATKPEAKVKTVKIDGKEYKDGDIVTKDGKQFRVKVK